MDVLILLEDSYFILQQYAFNDTLFHVGRYFGISCSATGSEHSLQSWPPSITKCGKRSAAIYNTTILTHCKWEKCLLLSGGRADSKQILETMPEDSLLSGLPRKLCYQRGKGETMEIHKAL